ncbi:hypothetical protein TNCV_951511 [Trichonephila clavipes]|nr:hypothetical protein TNCV_951511 [Trichonephila clavipes]
MNRCRFGGLSVRERPSVFKTQASLALIYRPNVAEMKAESTLPSPLIEPKTCGVEAMHTHTTRSYSVKNKNLMLESYIIPNE